MRTVCCGMLHYPVCVPEKKKIINCNWVATSWQWLFYMYTKYEIGYLLTYRMCGKLIKNIKVDVKVFENMVLRRIFEPRRDEVTGEWRRLHTEELNDLYCSPNIVRVIKSRRVRWAGHVARMGEERGVYRV